ncbi:hypothetical protein G6F58_012826 [Rhizopus delemar]|nr:hypothetical protein G6F58_012826 [Rhizopus delemar]
MDLVNNLRAALAGPSHAQRLLRLHTSLGSDVLVAETLDGVEQIDGMAGAADRAGRAAATATGRRQPAPAAWPHHRRRAAGQQWRPGALSAAPAAVAGVPGAAGGQLRLPRQDRGRDRRGPVRRLQRAGTGLALVAG